MAEREIRSPIQGDVCRAKSCYNDPAYEDDAVEDKHINYTGVPPYRFYCKVHRPPQPDPVNNFDETAALRSVAMERKNKPLASGCLDYFPDALLAVAECSRIGNEQHNPGEPLHWAKEKSTDEADALMRHLIDRGKLDSDGVRHTAKVAWRALALLQREIEKERSGSNQD